MIFLGSTCDKIIYNLQMTSLTNAKTGSTEFLSAKGSPAVYSVTT